MKRRPQTPNEPNEPNEPNDDDRPGWSDYIGFVGMQALLTVVMYVSGASAPLIYLCLAMMCTSIIAGLVIWAREARRARRAA